MENLLEDIKNNKGINENLTFERAIVLYRKLRRLSKEDKSLVADKNELKQFILDYEKQFETVVENANDDELERFDVNERIAELERLFIKSRKELLIGRLKKLGASQGDLGKLLGHTHKTYISQQINGVKPFTMEDLILINRILKIELKKLISPFVSQEKRNKFYSAKSNSQNERIQNLKLYGSDLALA